MQLSAPTPIAILNQRHQPFSTSLNVQRHPLTNLIQHLSDDTHWSRTVLKIESPELYKSILESLQIGVCLVNRDQKIVFWNDGAERITGFLKQEVLGRLHTDSMFAPSDEPQIKSAMNLAHPIVQVLRDGKGMTTDSSIQHKSGHQVPVRISTVPIRDEEGLIIAVAESFEEGFGSSERDRRESVLSKHGVLDETTGVACSGFIESQLREHLTTFETYPIPFSILCVQIDGIDQFRTTLGAGAIPVILRAVAQTMENCIRPSDSLGRLSDDRFLCILTECLGTQVASVAGRLRTSVQHDEIRWWGQKIAVTISVGGASARAGDTNAALIERAEASLRESLVRGGNCFTVIA
jgi:diguanylate cyclase (GGDEF)-like protein/PAS domain S-box-containing protein